MYDGDDDAKLWCRVIAEFNAMYIIQVSGVSTFLSCE